MNLSRVSEDGGGSASAGAGARGAIPAAPVPLEQQQVWRLGNGSLRMLVIDNYDSFTYNLVQTFVRCDVALEVVRNDFYSVEELAQQVGEQAAHCLVLSPGPGRPENAGICVELLRLGLDVPTLGVCLGHQALGLAFGADVDLAPRLMHGKTSAVRYGPQEQHPMFKGLDNPFVATRYHSLRVLEETLPAALRPLAWSEDGVLQAMAHRELPYWGVQFHPESILTEEGPQLLSNFVDFAAVRADIELAPKAIDLAAGGGTAMAAGGARVTRQEGQE